MPVTSIVDHPNNNDRMGTTHQPGKDSFVPDASDSSSGCARRIADSPHPVSLDAEPEESFDRITHLAACTLKVPAASISLIDATCERLKSRIGLAAVQLPRETSISAHAVDGRQSLVVEDATRDPRFARNPLVTGAPFVRGCLSIPFHDRNGQPVGALTAMDTQPRIFTAIDIAAWSDFARVVQDMIHAREVAVEGQRLLLAARASEQRHTEIERRLQRIADSIPALIGYWNTELRCEFANDAYRAFSGLPPEKMIGLHIRDVLGEKLFTTNSPHAYAALAGEPQRFQRRIEGPDGRPRDTEGQYLPHRDEDGTVLGFSVLVTDVTELTAAKYALEISNAKLLKESTTDFLTDLANRRVFTERCDATIAGFRKAGEEFALLLMDLDDFKHINDTFGHDNGDKVLQAVGEILRGQLRGRDDLAARLGGEEFAILCPGSFTEESLREMAERIRGQVNKATVDTPNGMVSFTSSFGIARSNTGDRNWTDTFARADAALYDAKNAGKNCIVFGRTTTKGATGRFRSLVIPTAK